MLKARPNAIQKETHWHHRPTVSTRAIVLSPYMVLTLLADWLLAKVRDLAK